MSAVATTGSRPQPSLYFSKPARILNAEFGTFGIKGCFVDQGQLRSGRLITISLTHQFRWGEDVGLDGDGKQMGCLSRESRRVHGLHGQLRLRDGELPLKICCLLLDQVGVSGMLSSSSPQFLHLGRQAEYCPVQTVEWKEFKSVGHTFRLWDCRVLLLGHRNSLGQKGSSHNVVRPPGERSRWWMTGFD